jgi:hypothetical protein
MKEVPCSFTYWFIDYLGIALAIPHKLPLLRFVKDDVLSLQTMAS